MGTQNALPVLVTLDPDGILAETPVLETAPWATAYVSEPQQLLTAMNGAIGPTGFFNRNEVGMRSTPLSIDLVASATGTDLVGVLTADFSYDGVVVAYQQVINVTLAAGTCLSTAVAVVSGIHVRLTWAITSGTVTANVYLVGEVPQIWQP